MARSIKILKFGGASVASPEHFEGLAEIVRTYRSAGTSPVVVVSAMGDTTDRLISLAKQVHPDPPRRELDMLVSAGERISIALLAMALEKAGIPAVSYTGSQSGILTCDRHAEARIAEVRPFRIQASLDRNQVVIVAGFQGVSLVGKEITTLGRGGSDTTAVALGVALGALCVDFFKDVDGIYTSDPHEDPAAQHIAQMSFEQGIQLVSSTSHSVLHPRCILLAKANHLPLFVRSFLNPSGACTQIGESGPYRPYPIFEGNLPASSESAVLERVS